MVFSVLALGLVWPIVSLVLGGIYFVGRIFYTVGYRISVNGRLVGAYMCLVSLFALLLTSIAATITWIMALP